MPGRAEIAFIAVMMILILAGCGVAVYFFFKTYKKEMAENAAREKVKIAAAPLDDVPVDRDAESQI